MIESFPSSIEVAPEGSPVASVIWMHGLGATGHDLATIPLQLGLPSNLAVRHIFPHAPSIPVTINQGLVMPAWYDIQSFGARSEDESGIRQTSNCINQLITREVERGIESNKIVIAGFSQGGAMALFAGLRSSQALAGIMVLSAYLLLAEKLDGEANKANKQTPIFQAHGLSDSTVPIEFGMFARDELIRSGYSVEWHEYLMPHQICPEELNDIGLWVTKVLRFDRETKE